MMKSVASSLSYFIIVSGFLANNAYASNSNNTIRLLGSKGFGSKKIKCLVYFTIIFAVDLIFTANEWEVYANYVFLAVTTAFIGRSAFVGSGMVKAKVYGYLKGFSSALTILVAFQWIIAFTGGITFVIFPDARIGDSVIFVSALSLVHLAVALLIRKYAYVVFRKDMSKRLLLIDIGAKLFFIAFFNLFFPMFFDVLGMADYSLLALVLLTTAVIFTIYREYSVSLEKQIAVHNSNLITVSHWAQRTIAKYEYSALSSDRHDGKSATDGVLVAPLHNAVKTIQTIENPILQALLYELAYSGEKLGITIDISVSPQNIESSASGDVSEINLNNYDLYTIINDFIESAIYEAKLQSKKSVCVEITYQPRISNSTDTEIRTKPNFSLDIKTYIENEVFDTENPDFRVKKDAIISQMRRNTNITISLIRADSFTQTLKVAG